MMTTEQLHPTTEEFLVELATATATCKWSTDAELYEAIIEIADVAEDKFPDNPALAGEIAAIAEPFAGGAS